MLWSVSWSWLFVKATYKEGLDFGRIYCYWEPTGNIRTFLECYRINRYYNVKCSAIWRQEKEERKSRTFTSFDVKLDVLHRELDRGSLDAQGTVEQFGNDSDVCSIYFLFLPIFVFLFLSWYTCLLAYWYQKLCSCGSSNQVYGQDYTTFTVLTRQKCHHEDLS